MLRSTHDPDRPRAADTRRVSFLMFHVGGSGGVARTVVNLANRLADSHEVELISLYRRREAPRFPVDPRVRVSHLLDIRHPDASGRLVPLRPAQHPEGRRVQAALDRRPTRLRPVPAEAELSLLTDLALRRKLRRLRPGLLVSTRPSLHLAAALWAPRRVATIGQDHLNFPARFANQRQAALLRAVIPRLDGYVVLTDADAHDYRAALPGLDTPITVIGNALSWPAAQSPAPLEKAVVVAAGRLSREKGFDRLIRAWGPVARDHPDWQLHLYGHGPERVALAGLVDDLGLGEQVVLKGYAEDLRSVLADASGYALSSHAEGFPMVLLEAMSVGLPMVAFDCPRGPGEIVVDGQNGRLVPDGDLPGLTGALRQIVEQPDLRRRLGRQAHQDAAAYEIDSVAADWEDLFERVARGRRG